MANYFIKTPGWVQKIFPAYTWKINTNEKQLYLTFDDGPHPQATPFVLDELKKVNAKATFFCIGKNVKDHPKLYRRILEEGHAVGNHTFNHLNGWKVNNKKYLRDISEASAYIDSNLFRPPFGRITPNQARKISSVMHVREADIIMWDVLSADFDIAITAEDCIRNVMQNATNGSIIVFHDSEKSFPCLSIALPVLLVKLKKLGFCFKKIKGKHLK